MSIAQILQIVLALSLCLFFTVCAKHTAIGVAVNRPGYSWSQIERGKFVVLARTKDNFRQALKEIGCGNCVSMYDGELEVWLVTKIEK